VRNLLRQSPRFFFLTALAGLALRLLFIWRFAGVTTDSFIYGDIAKNWLQHGIYGISTPTGVMPTFIRLPGYPAFLAAVFAVFGMEHYRTVLVLQAFMDLGTCFVTADLARRLFSPRAARTAFLLTAVCPFLADYAANALTETLEVFFTVLALDCAVTGLQAANRSFKPWIGCGVGCAAAILLRPDGGLLLGVIEIYLGFWLLASWLRRSRAAVSAPRLFWAACVLGVLSLAPLVPWTMRNLHTLHRFQPLAPRYANEENEFVPMGYNRWVKTWIADYVSVEEIYWQVPEGEMNPQQLPDRAFDSLQQRRQTEALLADYNAVQHVTPELDARFAALAAERIHHAPLRYYVWLPLLRIADMWLRPRTATLPSDTRWWEFNDDPRWSALAVAMGVMNLAYIGVALISLGRGRLAFPFGLLLLFVVLRSLFLGTLENPEPRYTLECYPVVVLLVSRLRV